MREEKLTVREACRRRIPIGLAETEALEHGLTQLEAENKNLREMYDNLELATRLARQSHPDGCVQAGLNLKREYGELASKLESATKALNRLQLAVAAYVDTPMEPHMRACKCSWCDLDRAMKDSPDFRDERYEKLIELNANLMARVAKSDLQVDALHKKLAYEKDYSIRCLECASRIGNAMEDCLAAMGRAYDKLEWLKGADIRDCQSQIKAAGERGRVALAGPTPERSENEHTPSLGQRDRERRGETSPRSSPTERPGYMCAARLDKIQCDLVNGHGGFHWKAGQMAETGIWWLIGDSVKVATACASHIAPRDTDTR